MKTLKTEELNQASGGFIPPLPKSLEIGKVDEHTGCDMKAGLPDGKIITETELIQVSAGAELPLMEFDPDPNSTEHKHSLHNLY